MKESTYKIQSPAYNTEKLNTAFDFPKLLQDPEVQEAIAKTNEEYLHWEELKYKTWIPKIFSEKKELFWTLIRMTRLFSSIPTIIKDDQNHTFTMKINAYSEFLHIVDKEMAGNFMGIQDFTETDKRKFIARSIIEESIASSQLEGANTSRAAAKKMLLEKRKPLNHSEQMIINNHHTMQEIEQTLYREPLSWELICKLHRMITQDTISSDKIGVLRETLDENGNRLVIKPWDDKTIVYTAPDKKFVEAELPKLIDFANNKEKNGFIHPLIKAIMLHFWIGLLHPFEDGNGRLARILFYWYMLRNEYWAFAYLALSEKIKKSPKQYAMAYIYSEQDNCDLTYFINYNIDKLKLARQEFQNYIKRKISENRLIELVSKKEYDLNERQLQLLHYFYKKQEIRINLTMYQKLFLVKKVTSIYDLRKLVEKKFLIKKRQGKNVFYYPSDKIEKLFPSSR